MMWALWTSSAPAYPSSNVHSVGGHGKLDYLGSARHQGRDRGEDRPRAVDGACNRDMEFRRHLGTRPGSRVARIYGFPGGEPTRTLCRRRMKNQLTDQA